MMRLLFFLFCLVLISLSSCDTSTIVPLSNNTHYIHVAHTRQADTITQKLDPRIEAIDYSFFDMILLGGDLTEETSKSYETLEYLDGIFDLDHANTLWALGNHDNANLEDVIRATKKPITYTYHKNGITFVVLYTQEEEDWKCTITGDQLTMLQEVMDTVAVSSHLVVMTHKLVWVMDNPEFAQYQGTSAYDWVCNYRIHTNNWNQDILPKLREVQERGVQVLCLAGDIGNNAQEFHELTTDGIHYLASGISLVEGKIGDSNILLFKHDFLEEKLFWRFANLDVFLENNQPIASDNWNEVN